MSSIKFSFVVKGNVPSKKNKKQIIYVKGRPLIISSKLFHSWHKEALPQLNGIGQITGIKSIELMFYPNSKRAADLTNKAESIMDLMVDAGVIEDDNWFKVPHITLKFGAVDKDNPRVEVTIKKHECFST